MELDDKLIVQTVIGPQSAVHATLNKTLMGKNILIFADGTGQAGGLRPDQNLSNIYKLYRACRPGPESPIDPREQVAFYDAGLGTENDGGRIPFSPVQKFRKLWSGATGTGISRNIIDCYEAVIKHYELGDRIFLFGFSRGAYTARCVGGVMSLCGIPTHGANGQPVPRYGKQLREIAIEAVREVYEHGSGSDKPAHKLERDEKARRFRAKYGSSDAEGLSNEVPYFIGVFDTVAALGAPGLRRWAMTAGMMIFAAAMIGLIALVLSRLSEVKFISVFWSIAALVGASTILTFVRTQIKVIRNFPSKGDFKWHRAAWRFRFYDNNLNPRVRYARHALAIDELRKDFARVQWGNKGVFPDRTGEPEWLKQVWFAGNHSDIGGSYPEDESRLSDIALQWMVGEAQSLPHPLQFDKTRLNLFPDHSGLQHCEIRSMRDAYPAWWPEKLKLTWAIEPREIDSKAPLHSTVVTRFQHETGVLHYGHRNKYLPDNLKNHEHVKHHYETSKITQVEYSGL